MQSKGMVNIEELKNIVVPRIIAHKDLNKSYHLYPDINNEKCVLCGKCAKICSESEYSALNIKNNEIVLDKTKCVGCSLCQHVCSKEAISMTI